MAVSQNTSGTQTATIANEHTLATITAAGVYTLQVDVNNHVLGDVTKLRAYLKTRSGDSSRLLYETTVPHVTTEKVIVSPPVAAVHEVKYTLLQSAGTGRSFDWSVFSLGATPAQNTSGSQTASIGSTHDLATVTDGNTWLLYVDTANMVIGDETELIATVKTLTGSTARVGYLVPCTDVQTLPIKVVGPVASAHSITFSLKQTAGTGRAYPWSLVSL